MGQDAKADRVYHINFQLFPNQRPDFLRGPLSMPCYRKSPALPVLAAIALATWSCSDRVAGGATEVGNSITLAGMVVTAEGRRRSMPGFPCFRENFDPGAGDSLPAAWETHTDGEGAYRSRWRTPAIPYPGGTGRAKDPGPAFRGEGGCGRPGKVVEQPQAKLAAPGSVTLPLIGEGNTGYFYFPGTRVFTGVDSAALAAGHLDLRNVPPGIMPP